MNFFFIFFFIFFFHRHSFFSSFFVSSFFEITQNNIIHRYEIRDHMEYSSHIKSNFRERFILERCVCCLFIMFYFDTLNILYTTINLTYIYKKLSSWYTLSFFFFDDYTDIVNVT